MFDYLVESPVVSGKLDVALGLRVNQYKTVCASLSPLNSLISVAVVFTGINNRLFLRKNRLFNNRLFFWCYTDLSFVSWLTEFLLCFFAENFILAEKVFENPL